MKNGNASSVWTYTNLPTPILVTTNVYGDGWQTFRDTKKNFQGYTFDSAGHGRTLWFDKRGDCDSDSERFINDEYYGKDFDELKWKNSLSSEITQDLGAACLGMPVFVADVSSPRTNKVCHDNQDLIRKPITDAAEL